jgi:hypothetical protein
MDVVEVFIFMVLPIFLGWLVWRLSKKTKKDWNTPNDNFDINSLRKIPMAHSSLDPGDPGTVRRVEELLKKEAVLKKD